MGANNNYFFTTFIDDFSRMSWLYVIKAKNDALEVFKIFKITIKFFTFSVRFRDYKISVILTTKI